MKNMQIKKTETLPRFEAVMKSETEFRIFDNLKDDWVMINPGDNKNPVLYVTETQEQAMLIADELNNKAKENV